MSCSRKTIFSFRAFDWDVLGGVAIWWVVLPVSVVVMNRYGVTGDHVVDFTCWSTALAFLVSRWCGSVMYGLVKIEIH